MAYFRLMRIAALVAIQSVLTLFGFAQSATDSSAIQRIGALSIGDRNTLLLQCFTMTCFGDYLEEVRIYRRKWSVLARYWCPEVSWSASISEDSLFAAIANLDERIRVVDPRCASSSSNFYLWSFNFRKLTRSGSSWYVGSIVDQDQVMEHALFERYGCGLNGFAWSQFLRDLKGDFLQLGSKEEKHRLRALRRKVY